MRSHARAQATIPMVEANAYARPWFIASMGASPLFITLYLGLFPSWGALAGALGAGTLLAGVAIAGPARLGGKAPVWGLGTGYPIGARGCGGRLREGTAWKVGGGGTPCAALSRYKSTDSFARNVAVH